MILPVAMKESADNLWGLKQNAEQLNVFLNEAEIESFRSYLDELRAWNQKINLVGRKDDQEIVIKDFLDSLTISKHLPPGSSLLDIGSGAGFPGIAVKIVRNDLHVALLEIRQKRVSFLLHIIRFLGLNDIKVFSAGAETPKDHFDFVVSRAFGSLEKFIEAGEAHLTKGGTVLAMKGKRGEEELKQESSFLKERGWMVSFLENIKLPVVGHDRTLIGLKKIQLEMI